MFILSTDCLLRMIMDSLPKQDILRGFADDLGFVTHNVFNSMKKLKPILDVIARISALHLNVAKCVIVPLWKYQEIAIRDALNDVCPGWHTMKIAEVAKYLGFWIGPGTRNRDWDSCWWVTTFDGIWFALGIRGISSCF